MDSITQAALGAVVGERLLGNKLGRSAIAWGALVGTLPDLDVLVYPWLDPIAELYWHRGISHTIWGVLIGTALFGSLLGLFWNREKGLQRRKGSLGSERQSLSRGFQPGAGSRPAIWGS